MAGKKVPTVPSENSPSSERENRKTVATADKDVPELRGKRTNAGSAFNASDSNSAERHTGGGRVADDIQGPITWHTERRRIGDLVEWEKNPRRLTVQQAIHLADSLKKFGYVEEMVLNADGTSIIGGHQRRRVLMAQALVDPDAEIDVRMPSRTLSDDEKEELAIRLNRNTGEWDWDKLANEFEQVQLLEWGFDPVDFAMVERGSPPPQDEMEGGIGGTVTCPNCGAIIKSR